MLRIGLWHEHICQHPSHCLPVQLKSGRNIDSKTSKAKKAKTKPKHLKSPKPSVRLENFEQDDSVCLRSTLEEGLDISQNWEPMFSLPSAPCQSAGTSASYSTLDNFSVRRALLFYTSWTRYFQKSNQLFVNYQRSFWKAKQSTSLHIFKWLILLSWHTSWQRDQSWTLGRHIQ